MVDPAALLVGRDDPLGERGERRLEPEVGGHAAGRASREGSGGSGRSGVAIVGGLPGTVNADRARRADRPGAPIPSGGLDLCDSGRMLGCAPATPRPTSPGVAGERSTIMRPARPVLAPGPAASALAVSTARRAEGPAPDPRVAGLRVPARVPGSAVVAAEPAVVAPGRRWPSTTSAGSTSSSGSRATGPSRPASPPPARRRDGPDQAAAEVDARPGQAAQRPRRRWRLRGVRGRGRGGRAALGHPPYKGSLLLGCVGRLERWADGDGDGRFETRAILVDGLGRRLRGLVGIDPRPRRLALPEHRRRRRPRHRPRRLAGRPRPDGRGLPLPARRLASSPCSPPGSATPGAGSPSTPAPAPILVDDGPDDGSKFAGVRLLPRSRGGTTAGGSDPAPVDGPDFDRGRSTASGPASSPASPGWAGGRPPAWSSTTAPRCPKPAATC